MGFREEIFQAKVSNANGSENTNGSTIPPASTEVAAGPSTYLHDDRSLNGSFDDTSNSGGEFRPNLYRLIELRSDTSTAGTVDKAIIHPIDLGKLCNALAPESYQSVKDIRFEKLGTEPLDLVGCYGNRELILKLLLQSNCINQDKYDELVQSERDPDSVRTSTLLTTGLYLLLIKPHLGF
ncbi:6448_t:CDS:2, partial [Paraglomus brasilianum]